jgi:dipeptidyl aminopeptidase/acylaminoacyl peptidase
MKFIALLLLASVTLPFASVSAQSSGESAVEKKFTAASQIPVDVFFRRPLYAEMAISPDGRKLAAIAPLNGRGNLVVIDLDKRNSRLISAYRDFDVYTFQWISNDRLYLRAGDIQAESGSVYLRAAAAVDADGTNVRDLMRPTSRGVKVGTATQFDILRRAHDGSGDAIVQMNERASDQVDVYRYNTRNGEHKLLTFDNPGNVISWVVDRNDVPRVAVRLEPRTDPNKSRQRTLWHRPSADARWEKIGGESDDVTSGTISPLGFDYDNTTLYVSSNLGQDRRAIYKYDIGNKKLGERLAAHPLIDLSGGLIFSANLKKLAGVRYSAEQDSVVWLDDAMSALQAAIDKALPSTTNVIRAADDQARYVLIDARSDVDAGSYYLYDTEKRTLERVAQARPWLPAELMSERRFIRYKARDGREIPAWVTVPRGSSGKNLPLIVHIHGGPWVRSYYGAQWSGDPIAQFFASRGYAVLEPEPRGSTGFGKAHYNASFKQFGLAMQDDITDGALHLVAEGIADKNRMCLFGASYGGYATLQGLVKDPDLWKCGNAYVAVTDLELWQSIAYSDTARFTDFFETDFKRRVGDKTADREQFDKTSPVKNADKIKAAVMLTMGGQDQRVPLAHGSAMRNALEKAGKKLEYKIYDGEAHGFNKLENVVDFYTRSEKFFAEHLKK